ncbi:lytic transglycosylase domain-containing protein [Actibacterium ureilyticum]|uniref:lytic transglycosylase domain-containing protein n=1 Tax=Actibacterium ureilyticum TaxID=1590614 RepID=UPI000BAB0C88|nr:lytic transglycosylase domain-containing protein [Actibacterium ureilyticum]
MYFKRALALALAVVIAHPAAAEDPPPYPKVVSKRVKPPKPGASKRITVQIRTLPGRPAVTVDPAKPPQTPRTPTSAAYDWYWQEVSPALDDSGPGRLSAAVTALSQGPNGRNVATPRLQHMQEIMSRHGPEILQATVGTQVSPALVLAVIGVESSGRIDAVSPKGATGLMQLMPATATRFGVNDSGDPAQNIRGGVAYLNWLMSEFDRDPVLVMAAYNAGENAVRNHKGVPPYAETRDYVPKVLAAWTVARGLCRTPPELISDGCAFMPGRPG